MDILSSNLNGKASANFFLRSLPAVEVFSYQCSPLSKSEGLQHTFEAAHNYKKNSAPDTIVVVLLNEIGLLEQSPYHPLKVLHKELDQELDIAIVGLSNWSLDPSIINKAVYLSRPPPSEPDLKETVRGIVSSIHLHSTLSSLARAYLQVYKTQEIPDFFALRDFYSLVKYINRKLTNSLTPNILRDGLVRNFGGRGPEEMKRILQIFFKHTIREPIYELPNVITLIKENHADHNARNLMILTKQNAALPILFDKILSYKNAQVIFGSDFPNDKSNELYHFMNIQKIKQCMAIGKTVVLVNCEPIYESLVYYFNINSFLLV